MELEKIIKHIRHDLKKHCHKQRREHGERVAQLACKLADKFTVNKKEAELVGLAHDLLREWPGKKLIKFALANGYIPKRSELQRPILLHGHCSALWLKKHYYIKNESILNALRNHTLGRAPMDMLGILLYVCDYIEPGRKYLSEKTRMKILDLPPWEMVLAVIKHAKKRNKSIHPYTRQLNSYARILAKQGNSTYASK